MSLTVKQMLEAAHADVPRITADEAKSLLASANALTNQALDPFGKIPEFKFCAARFKAEEREAAE